jgi:acetyl/propionyl-CoA carboxylase alpha subunit
LKLRIDVDGAAYFLEFFPEKKGNGERIAYSVDLSPSSSGSASILETMPGVFSVLLGDRSFLVNVGPGTDGELEVWTSGEERYTISLADMRDRSSRRAKTSGDGPVEVRAQMPGKVVKVLVAAGTTVEAGQGLVVVEAMKMQNEMKAPKGGRVVRIHAREGATVTAGEPLAVVE